MKRIGYALFLSCMFLSFLLPEAKAFSISPLKYHLTVAPGTSGQTVSLEVYNDADQEKQFLLKVLGAKQDDAGRLTYGQVENIAESWVRPETSSISIPGKKSKKISFIINIPLGAIAGSYYLGLAAEESVGQGNNVGISGQLIAPVLLQVAGVVNESMSIESWEHPPIIFWQRHWQSSLSLKNNGNVELPFKGSVVVRDWRGKEYYRQELNLGEVLLPGSGRAFASQIKLPYGNFYLPGPYSAELIVNYGRTGQTIAAVESIWFFPPSSIIVIAVIIAAVIYFKLKKKKHE